MRPAQGLRSFGFREFAADYRPGKPRFADRKGQIEPIGRTPMSVRYRTDTGVAFAQTAAVA
jgi:hypothetical protein